MSPALAAAIVALTNAILAVVVNFGVNLTDDQRVSIVALTNAVLVVAALVLHGVTRNGNAAKPPGV